MGPIHTTLLLLGVVLVVDEEAPATVIEPELTSTQGLAMT